MELVRNLLYEIKTFTKGQTIDALLPTVSFFILSNRINLLIAAIISLLISLTFFIIRLIRKETWYYSIGGFIGVLVASGFALTLGQSKNYFLPDIISSFLIGLGCLISSRMKIPLAAWLSHITRGWPLEWYKRPDIRPAYFQVTLVWFLFFFIRFILLLWVYLSGNDMIIFITNIVMGLPFTLVLLSFSYIYGIIKLSSLKGPGVDEYKTSPPWKGQKKGF
jgi:hypothetical protein